MKAKQNFKKLLQTYCTKAGDKYILGVLHIYPDGNVYVDPEVKKNHFVGHINTLKELKGVCELWNNKELEEYEY